MSLLAGIGQGLQGAGQAISQGLYAYAQAMREDELERMRQASMEKRWAKEDARYERAQAKDDQRYNERNAKDDARYQDSVKFREQDAVRADARDSRQDDKQSAMMLGQSLDRLDSIKNAKAKEIADMFTDPMTKQVTDPEAYRSAMSALQQSYIEDAGKIVQRSGLSDDQVNKYGFSMYLSEPAAVTDKIKTEVVTPPPVDDYDKKKWFEDVRKTKSTSTIGKDENGLTYALFGNGVMGEPSGTLGQRLTQFANKSNNRNTGHFNEEQARQYQQQVGVPDYSYPPIATGLLGKINR